MISTTNLERIVLVMTVGLCEAIKTGKLSINESQGILFSPHTMDLLEARGSKVAHIIHSCTELEDLESLLPHELLSSLDEFKEEALDMLVDDRVWEFEETRWLTVLVDGSEETS